MPAREFWIVVSAVMLLAAGATVRAQVQVGTGFTYQGRLMVNGVPAEGAFDFRLILWDAEDGGNQVSGIQYATADVGQGLVTLLLDFGAVFEGNERWLEVAVRPAGSGAYQTLSPRQPVTPTPYAVTAQAAGSASGLTGRPVSDAAPTGGQVLGWDGIQWSPADAALYSAGAGLVLNGTTFSIAPLGVTTAMLADGAVTDGKMTDVAWSKISGAPSEFPPTGPAGGDLTGFYPNPQIAGGAVTTAVLADGAVTDAKVMDVAWSKISGAPAAFPPSGPAGGDLAGAYPAPQIADGAVMTSHLADAAVQREKLADGAVSDEKVTDVSWSKITGVPGAFPPSGPAGGDLSGTYPNPLIAGGAVTSFELALDPASLARVTNDVAFVFGGNFGIGTSSPGDLLTVAGVVQSSSGGFRFPDGTIQTTAATAVAWGRTPQQIAMLRWYEANEVPNRFSFPGGTYGGEGIAFDGDHMWVTKSGFNDLHKYRASDGTLISTYSTGVDPVGVCFDGANIWVANSGSDTVTKRRASDGGALGTFAVGDRPKELCFDGASIWVVNELSDNVSKLRASDGALLGTYAVGDSPRGVCFDGANIWVAIPYPGSAGVAKLRASDGELLGTYSVGYYGPWGVCFDGTNIWAAVPGSDYVAKLRASDGTLLDTYAAGDGPWGVCYDGANIWVSNLTSGDVTKLRASDGALLGTYLIGSSNLVRRVAFDGAAVWVVDWYGLSKL